MKKVSLRANAKVNYALEVTGVREDGYHTIRTVFQSISLYDEVEVETSPSGFEVAVEPSGLDVGAPEENTVFRAWRLLCGKVGENLPAKVLLRKKVPAGAGLGGGSADAAAALVGMNVLFGLGLSEDDLRGIGAGVGADVPFCVSGGTMLGEGVGTILTALPAPPEHAVAVVKPKASASTAEVYRLYDRRAVESKGNAGAVAAALGAGSLSRLAGSVGNDLAPVSAALVSEVARCERALLRAGALGSAMSGSGSAVYGLFEGEEEARRALEGSNLAGVALGVFRPVRRGVEEV